MVDHPLSLFYTDFHIDSCLERYMGTFLSESSSPRANRPKRLACQVTMSCDQSEICFDSVSSVIVNTSESVIM
jgi:hypothetical protein